MYSANGQLAQTCTLEYMGEKVDNFFLHGENKSNMQFSCTAYKNICLNILPIV